MLAKQKTKQKKKKPASAAPASRGFGAKAPSPVEESLIKEARKTLRATAESSSAAEPWLILASSCAEVEEYAEARMVLEAGIAQCGSAAGSETLIGALGQMRRVGSSQEVEEAGEALAWPGKGDESPYDPSEHRFLAFSSPAWPSDSPRGSYYPTGESAVRLSETPVLDPSECAWVVAQAEQAWAAAIGDFADDENIGSDKIWDKPFPDRLWLREVRNVPCMRTAACTLDTHCTRALHTGTARAHAPHMHALHCTRPLQVPGLLAWFEHRLRTRLFPMLQLLYPEAIPRVDCLRCHDAFVSRYDASGMASLEVHQDTTDFTFTIALNPLSEYEGGGTVMPDLRAADAEASAPYETIVVKPDVGCVTSFPGRLRHGGNAISSGFRYIIPLFIYLDVNKATGKPRGWLLESAGIRPGHMTGLDAMA